MIHTDGKPTIASRVVSPVWVIDRLVPSSIVVAWTPAAPHGRVEVSGVR